MKKKKKRKPQAPNVLTIKSAFLPIFPSRMGTPTSATTAPSVPDVPAESVIPPSQKRVVHEMRQVFNEFATAGHSAPNAIMIDPLTGAPAMDMVGSGGVYNFKSSPGLGFRTEAGWKVWRAALEIIPRYKNLTINDIMQQAMQRAGIRVGDIDAAEVKLLEMGLQWYLSNQNQAATTSSGTSGVPLAVLDRKS